MPQQTSFLLNHLNTSTMASKNETGHAVNLANYQTLIVTCEGFGPRYKPANPALAIAALEAQYKAADDASNDLRNKESLLTLAQNDRQEVLVLVKPLSTRIVNALSSSGATDRTIADARTISRKIQGSRAGKATTEEEEAKQISVSQQSADQLISNYKRLVALVSLAPTYATNEEDLKIPALDAFAKTLEEENEKVVKAENEYNKALDLRNELFYSPTTGLVDTAKLVKDYVKSAFKITSPEYREISGIPFRKLVRS